jgi:uncharacterized membrane protein
MNEIKVMIIGYIILLVIDNIYLYLNRDFYKDILDKTQEINIIAALISWMVIIISINLLVLSRNDINEKNALIYGAYLGFSMYGVYNLTNYATYPNKWNMKILIGDTAWGTLITSMMSYILYKIMEKNEIKI